MKKIILLLVMLPLVGCGPTRSTTTTYSTTPVPAVSKTYTPGGTVTTYSAPVVQQRTVTTTTD